MCWDPRLIPTDRNASAALYYVHPPREEAALVPPTAEAVGRPPQVRRNAEPTRSDPKGRLVDYFVEWLQNDILGRVANAHLSLCHEPESIYPKEKVG